MILRLVRNLRPGHLIVLGSSSAEVREINLRGNDPFNPVTVHVTRDVSSTEVENRALHLQFDDLVELYVP